MNNLLQAVFFFLLTGTALANDPEPLNFSRDIRPILSDKCFACHGPDAQERSAGFRIDTMEGALEDLGGYAGVVPGDPQASEVVLRIANEDPDMRMPPTEHKNPLSSEEIELLTRWIAEGAAYAGHWAFEPVRRPPLRAVENAPHHPIDQFIAARLEQDGLDFSPAASPETLIRRLYLDLTGLPPTPADVEAFLENPNAQYEATIDRLMDDSAFAERLAIDWLDVARFADTNGYSIDDHRDMWVWRDWVIDAFKKNMPYDQFIREQVAGDLMENATESQRIATGFLRNSMNTHEGGTIAEEYRVASILDKVDTVSTAFLGLTMRCAQCHDHKYDPISQRDYYRFFAFFNASTETGFGGTNGNTNPVIEVAPLLQDDASFRKSLEARIASLQYLKGQPEELLGDARKVWEKTTLAKADASPLDAQTEAILHKPDCERTIEEQNLIAVEFAKTNSDMDKLRKSIDGEIGVLKKSLESGKTTTMVMDDAASDRKTPILLRGQYDQHGEIVEAGIPKVFADLPASDRGSGRATRLTLARWLTDPNHPLTSRVTVNRYWQLLFGVGLVKTSEDFGSQGEWPSHPELLDWLASDFVASGWDVRALLKSILLSKAYRQSSVVSAELLEHDPYNRLYARAPRYRLSAEAVRDNSLMIAGLLCRDVGGPSVYPPQPLGLWKEVSHFGYPGFFSAQHYFPDRDQRVYRRSLYTFWKRTSPPPVMTTFDAPNRETCSVRRSLTNTPLQALVLMNAPQFVEASRGLALRMLGAGETKPEQIGYGFRLATAREPSAKELPILEAAYQRQLAYFSDSPQRTEDYLRGSEVAGGDDQAELAAMTSIASLILNLDETITRE